MVRTHRLVINTSSASAQFCKFDLIESNCCYIHTRVQCPIKNDLDKTCWGWGGGGRDLKGSSFDAWF